MNNVTHNTSIDVVGSGINSFLLKSFWEESFAFDIATITTLIGSYENKLRSISNNKEEFTTHLKIGILYSHINQYTMAEQHFSSALRLNPTNPEAHLHHAFSLLSQGKLHKGFREFEYRFWLNREQANLFESLGADKAYKEGVDLYGQRLLVLPEHGFGETFQFVRFISNLKSLYGSDIHITFAVQRELYELFSRYSIDGLDSLVPVNEISNLKYDYYIPLLSLPIITNIDDIDSIKSNNYGYIKYVLNKPARSMGARPKIGIAWTGCKERNNNLSRSLSREDLIQLVEGLEGEYDLYSLQHSNYDLLDSFDNKVTKIIDEESSFLDTSEAIKKLDVVVSVCTSTLHLAGSMGITTYGLISANGNWRWFDPNNVGLNAKTPWYPSVTLIRQDTIGDWRPAINHLIKEVKNSLTSTSTRTFKSAASLCFCPPVMANVKYRYR